jgi:hypothetical protein
MPAAITGGWWFATPRYTPFFRSEIGERPALR